MRPIASAPIYLALAALLVPMAAICSGCDTSLGVEGSAGLTASGTFTGITSATVLSPTSVKVTWNTSSNYGSYQIYSSSSPFPLGNTIFSSFTITGLTPASQYSFSVGGVPTSGSTNIDGLSQVIGLNTWPMFTGLAQLQATSPVSLQASWSFNDPSGNPISGPDFNVFVAQGDTVSDFSTPAVSTNATSVGITQLANGAPITANTRYTVVVRATYLDGTGEYNQSAMSVTTPSNISPLPTIATDAVIIGSWPQLNVTGGLASYQTSFKLVTYPSGPTGPTGTRNLGSVNGNNSFKVPTSQALPWGQNTIIPTVTSQGSSVDLAPVNVVSRSVNTSMFDFPAFYSATGPSGTMLSHGYQQLGSAMAVGDFNCDGYMDLAIGAPRGTFNPLYNQGPTDGGVYVFYGSSQGLITSPAPSISPTTATAPLLITRPLMNYGTGGLQLGTSLAAGNLNGDTNPINGKACDDLAVGMWSTGGEVWVYFGSTQGLQYSGSPADQTAACSGTNCVPLRITAPAGSISQGPLWGSSLAIGRLHQPIAGDAYRDLLIGAAYEQVAGMATGSAFIFYGGASGINFTNPAPYATTGLVYTKLAPPAMPGASWGFPFNFGLSAAALDMDGDTIDDIVIGAPVFSNSTNCTADGAVFYYGSKANNVASQGFFPSTSTYVQLTNPLNPPNAGCAGSVRFGGALANAGDINNDGYADLIVTDALPSGISWTGQGTWGATVFYGGTNGPQTTNGCASLHQAVGNSSPVCATNVTASCGTAAGLGSGQCKVLNIPYNSTGGSFVSNYIGVFSAGASANSTMSDVNGDGYADIMVGWVFDGYGSNVERSDVYYGGPNGLQAGFSKISPLVLGPVDDFGWGVALGNFNGDLYTDAAGAAPMNFNLNGGYGGVVMEFDGKSGGLGTTVTGYTKLLAPNLSKESWGGMGFAVNAGDINGDGYTDIAVALPRSTSSQIAIYPFYTEWDLVIYYGSANGTVTTPNPSLNPLTPTAPLLVPAPNGYVAAANTWQCPLFDFVGAAGDVNGDGYADIIAGSPADLWHGGAQNVFLYFGSNTGLQVAIAPAVPPTTGLNPMIVAQSDATSVYALDGDPWGWVGQTGVIGTGDFNGDGYADVILGAGSMFSGTATNVGAALVLYGSSLGLQTDGILQRTPTGGPDVALTAPCSGTAPNLTCKAQLLIAGDANYFGTQVAGVGDVNKDGYADAIVGSPNNNTLGSSNGVVYLYMGSPTGLLMWDSTTSNYDNLNGSNTGLLLTPPLLTGSMTSRLFGRLGISPAGDVNGDGYADFLVASVNESAAYGGTFLFYGCGNGLNSSAPQAGCPSTGVWGVPAPPAVASVASIVTNAASCTSAGCSILFFYPSQSSVSAIAQWTGNYWGEYGGGVGDVNRDGFADVFQGTTSLLQPCTGSACATYYITAGGGVLYTGSSTGLVVNQGVTRTPNCTGGACTPYWLTPPVGSNWGQPGYAAFYDFSNYTTFLNPTPADYNGDGYPDILMLSDSMMNDSQTTAFHGGMFFFQ